MKRRIYLGSFLVVLAAPLLAADTAPREVRKVEVVPANGDVRVEITLSSPVAPSVEIARNPDRIILKFPATASPPKQTRISFNRLGVRSVRYGLNASDPPETHLVVDLDQERTYKVLAGDIRIVLIIAGPPNAAARRRASPAGAASRPLISSLGRRPKSSDGQATNPNDRDLVLLTPPPSGPPIQFPPAPNDGSSSQSASASTPSAAHPNRGSLQEGTVFPNEGLPGAGVVPPVSESPRSSGSDDRSRPAAAIPQPKSVQPAQPQEIAKAVTSSEPVQPHASANAAAPSTPPRIDASAKAAVPPSPVPVLPATIPRKEVATLPSSTAGGNFTDVLTHNIPIPIPLLPDPTPVVAENEPDVAPDNDSGSGSGRVAFVAHAGENADFRTAFRVKYVAQDAAYLDGGRAAGLAEGMRLIVRDLPVAGAVAAQGSNGAAAGDVAELEVLSVAETSSVTEIHLPKRPVKVGDLAYLSSADQQSLVQKNALSATRKYPAVVSFTESDTLDDEARAEVPKPPLPSVNRARGRIGFDYIGVVDHGGSGMVSNNVGLVMNVDITRISGTYWNVSGYWRGRFNSTSGPQTLQDLINRTYHLYTSYDNPTSAWVAGFGRMYLPWATSLDTIDGGYFGRKVRPGVIAGLFMGSTPDPTSYNYNPDLEIGGGFVNFEGGSFDDLHYSSTSGGGMKMLKWSPDRPFLFFENTILYRRIFSIYQASQIDSAAGYWFQDPSQNNTKVWQPGTGWGVGRSFLTMRIQPHPRVEFDFNHTYFRDLPTFNAALIDTGLLDKYLMQGFSGGTRVEVAKQIWLSASLGMSNRTGDQKNSLNQMYGITFGSLPWIGLHADVRYTRFNSSFGSGSYEAFSFSKNLGETLQLQFLAGQQNFASSLTSATRSRFLNGMIETSLGSHYFVQAGGTVSRGDNMNYDQVIFTFGYRFDNRHGHRGQ